MQKPHIATQQPLSKGTIDEKHTEMLNHFHAIGTYMDIKYQIRNISEQIKTLKSLKKQYLLDNSKHIFDYFEQKKKGLFR